MKTMTKRCTVYDSEYMSTKAAYFELFETYVEDGYGYREAYRQVQRELPLYSTYESFKVIKSRRQHRKKNMREQGE